jgi:hypothetical protein
LDCTPRGWFTATVVSASKVPVQNANWDCEDVQFGAGF